MTLPRLNPSFPSGSPKLGAIPPPSFPGGVHVQRLQIQATAGLFDTSSYGDMPLPTQYNHAMIVWRAADTSANTVASFAGMQIAQAGGAIDQALNYVWTSWFVRNTSTGVLTTGSEGSPNGNGGNWNAIITTGGGTGAQWSSKGTITIPYYSATDLQASAYWDMLQIDSGAVVRRMGSGYHIGAPGPVTKVRFFSGVGNFVNGTTFDLFVSQ